MTQTVRFNPFQIALIAAAESENNELGCVVWMRGEDEFFQRFDLRVGGFEQDENLGAAFNFSLPPVMRFDFRNEIGARCEASLQSLAGKCPRHLQTGCGDENDFKSL